MPCVARQSCSVKKRSVHGAFRDEVLNRELPNVRLGNVRLHFVPGGTLAKPQGHEIANLKLEKPKIVAFQSSSLRFDALANGFANVPPSTKYNRTFPRRTFPIGNSRFKSSPLKSHVCAVLPLKQRQCVRSPQPHHRGPCRPHHRGPSPYARRLQHRGRVDVCSMPFVEHRPVFPGSRPAAQESSVRARIQSAASMAHCMRLSGIFC